MKFFDAHRHLPSPDAKGLSELLFRIEQEPEMVGGNLILNTKEEVNFAYNHIAEFPSSFNFIPLIRGNDDLPEEFRVSGWFKIHPRIQKLGLRDIPDFVTSIAAGSRPRGLIVHCFPWGTNLDYNTSLPLVIKLAETMPDVWVVVAHGGGYESWAFRAHTGMLRNVVFEFSVTMSFYQGSDLLRPFQRYLRYSPDRLLFGSDWPSADCAEQISECLRLASAVGMSENELESLLLANSKRLWPITEPKLGDFPLDHA